MLVAISFQCTPKKGNQLRFDLMLAPPPFLDNEGVYIEGAQNFIVSYRKKLIVAEI